ncbi:MAG: RCC1 domain-containing protein [Gaiellales bacterium]
MRTLRLLPLVLVLVLGGLIIAGCGNLVGVGGGLSCVVQSDGAPNCFGGNASGQAGRPASATAAPGVVSLPKGYGAAEIAVGPGAPNGQTAACAAVGKSGSSGGGQVRCWGDDTYGQLGRGSAGAPSPTPVRVNLGAGRDSSTIAVGGTFACAIAGSDGVACWGTNSNGQLGNATPGIAAPTDVPGTATFRGPGGASGSPSLLAAGGAHACAGISARIACWGAGAAGQLGNGANADSPTPVAVKLPATVDGVAQIAAGASSTCAVASDKKGGTQRAWCWGANESGQLGDGTTTASNMPVRVTVPDGVEAKAVSVGVDHACLLASDEAVWCWGANASGQLGNGTTTASATPVQIAGVKATLIGAGAGQTCASTTSGRLVCWGTNALGQLGTAAGGMSGTPHAVPGITGLRAPLPKAAKLTGRAAVGSTLTAKTAAWPFALAYAYTWSRKCGGGQWSDIAGAKKATLKVREALAGCSVRVQISGNNAWTEAGVAMSESRTSRAVSIP